MIDFFTIYDQLMVNGIETFADEVTRSTSNSNETSENTSFIPKDSICGNTHYSRLTFITV